MTAQDEASAMTEEEEDTLGQLKTTRTRTARTAAAGGGGGGGGGGGATTSPGRQPGFHRTRTLDEPAIRQQQLADANANNEDSTGRVPRRNSLRGDNDNDNNNNNGGGKASGADFFKSAVTRSLTGDLDDIVNSVARRAGRRRQKQDPSAVVLSPTRTQPHHAPAYAGQGRVPRGARIRNTTSGGGGGDTSPKSPTRRHHDSDDDSSLSCGNLGIVEEEEEDKGGDFNASCRSVASNRSLDQRPSALSLSQRQSTVDSRDRFIKMLEAKTLSSFRSLNHRVVENNKPRTYMSRLFVTFQDCLVKLGASNVDDNRKLEAMAILIHECMSGDSRNYHSVQHVFDISKDFSEEDPIAVLAAMFHDCIYYNVDGGLNDLQKQVLHGCFHTTANNDTVACRAHHSACSDDVSLCMVETIFGYQPGQEITQAMGLNEFLSAVVAARQLEDHLTKQQCALIACCIAATIPFRNKPPQEEGKKSYMESLYDYLVETNEKFQLEMTEEELVQGVQRAAMVANADIANFGSDDIYYFLDNTWSLLTETNTTLRRSFLFTVLEFQHSLYKMNGFFHFLDPSSIFATFRNVPPAEEIQARSEQARKNLEFGQKYVGAKLLSASVLAAFAVLTGGDAPLSMFVGDLPSRHHRSQSINDALPGAGEKPFFSAGDDEDVEDHVDMLVYQILVGGRRSETSFDVKQSPLGAFLYAVVGDKGLKMILEQKGLYPMTEENAVGLLSCLPREVTRYLAKTIASVAVSRSEAIMQVVDGLPMKHFARATAVSEEHGGPPDTITVAEGEGEELEVDKSRDGRGLEGIPETAELHD